MQRNAAVVFLRAWVLTFVGFFLIQWGLALWAGWERTGSLLVEATFAETLPVGLPFAAVMGLVLACIALSGEAHARTKREQEKRTP